MTVTTRAALPLHTLAEKGLLWHCESRVPLNGLDARLTADIYDAYLQRRSRLYVYPIPCHILPPLIVATILISAFQRSLDRSRVPRVLFYSGVDGRDLYRDLGVGQQCEKISETFQITRLNAEGLPIEPVKLRSQPALVVTCHCVLPNDQTYRPDVIAVDADAFEPQKLIQMLNAASSRWPTSRFYVVTSNPVSPLIGTSSKLGWDLVDLLRVAGEVDSKAPGDFEFANVCEQLAQFSRGVEYRCQIVAEDPSPSWIDLSDSLAIARKHRGSSRAARQFVALTRLLLDLAVLPSEYDSFRSAHMLPIAQRIQIVREEAKREGKTAQLIAGGCSVLSDVCGELDKRNWKREALFEDILEACYAKQKVTVLVNRPGMRVVLSQALQLIPEFVDMLKDGDLRVISSSDVSRAECSDRLLVPGTLSAANMWALRTTLAPTMTLLSYSSEVALQNWCLRELGLLEVSRSLGDLPKKAEADEPAAASADGFTEIDLAELFLPDDASIEELVALSKQPVSGPRRQIFFEDGTSNVVADGAMLHVVVDADEPLKTKRAKAVEPGDWIVIVNGDAQQDLFEVLREHVDAKTTLSQALAVVRGFQRTLLKSFIQAQRTVETLHALLVQLGSGIQSPASVGQWIDGTRFGPSDAKDIVRLGKALDVPAFEERYLDLYRSMQRVRIAHRELGRVLVRVITNAYRETDSKSIHISVDGETVVLYDVLQAVTLRRVQKVQELK